MSKLSDFLAVKCRGWTESKPFGVEWMGEGLSKVVGLEKDDFHPDSDSSGSLEQAFECLEVLIKQGYSYLLCNGLDGNPHGCILTKTGYPGAEVSREYGKTPQLAISLAIAKNYGWKEESNAPR